MHWLGLFLVWVLIRGEIEELVPPRGIGFKLFALFNGWHSFHLSPSSPFLKFPMHPTSPDQGGWHGSKTSGGWWNLALWGLFFFFHVPLALGPCLPQWRTPSPPLLFSPVAAVGSNSIAAKLHSSCPALPAFTLKAPFPTDQISLPCWGKKKYFVFKSIF